MKLTDNILYICVLYHFLKVGHTGSKIWAYLCPLLITVSTRMNIPENIY